MGLSKDVEKAIKDNLPGQTAGVLKQYFEDHDQLDKDHKDLKKTLESKESLLKHYQEENLQLSSYRDRLSEIEKGEKGLAEKKIQFRIDAGIQEIREQHSIERVQDHKDMFSTVFRNTVLRENIMNSVPVKNQDLVQNDPVDYGKSIAVSGGESLLGKTDIKTKTEE